MQVVGARQRLKGFVNKQYGSDAVADQFIRGIAEVLIDNGLNKRIPTGFQLQWVELAIVGHKLAHLRKQLQPDATTISSVLDRLSLRHYFIFGKKGGKHPLMMPNMLQLLPQASKPVKKLLPDLTWVKQQVPNASSLVPSASTTAESSLQSVASTSNHLTAGHVWQLDGSSSLSSTMSATDRTAASVPPEVSTA